MSVDNQRQLQATRAKLRLLQEACEKVRQNPGPNAYVDDLTLDSLQSQMKQLEEEIRRYEIRVTEAAGKEHGE
ncbi:MAG TPA: hypothetical protein VG013_12890 [Gemmataceae bacterium]|jgi:hypothetical protein|nr:hypothetical protein [Gemmataceae bacterium]